MYRTSFWGHERIDRAWRRLHWSTRHLTLLPRVSRAVMSTALVQHETDCSTGTDWLVPTMKSSRRNRPSGFRLIDSKPARARRVQIPRARSISRLAPLASIRTQFTRVGVLDLGAEVPVALAAHVLFDVTLAAGHLRDGAPRTPPVSWLQGVVYLLFSFLFTQETGPLLGSLPIARHRKGDFPRLTLYLLTV